MNTDTVLLCHLCLKVYSCKEKKRGIKCVRLVLVWLRCENDRWWHKRLFAIRKTFWGGWEGIIRFETQPMKYSFRSTRARTNKHARRSWHYMGSEESSSVNASLWIYTHWMRDELYQLPIATSFFFCWGKLEAFSSLRLETRRWEEVGLLFNAFI